MKARTKTLLRLYARHTAVALAGALTGSGLGLMMTSLLRLLTGAGSLVELALTLGMTAAGMAALIAATTAKDE